MKLKNQAGMALAGWLIIITLLGFFLNLFFKIFPVYFTNYGVRQAFEMLIHDPEVKTKMPEQIRDQFNKYLSVNSISTITADKLVVTDNEIKRVLQLDYEVRKPFLGNIDFVISFHYQESV